MKSFGRVYAQLFAFLLEDEREREVEDGGELETLVNCRVFLREEESVLEKFPFMPKSILAKRTSFLTSYVDKKK